MDLKNIMQKLEAAKAEHAAAQLRVHLARKAIQEDEFVARDAACRAVREALIAAICDNPIGVNALEVLQRACSNCDDRERFWRAYVLLEAISGRNAPRRGLPALRPFVVSEENRGPDPIFSTPPFIDTELWVQ